MRFIANILLLLAVTLVAISSLTASWTPTAMMICLLAAIIGSGLRIEAAIHDSKTTS